MLHKRSAALILAMTLPALAGCVQATRHSNTMVFGTNTSLAVRVGQGVNQIPEVSVGYARQEAVIMPLLANTQEKGEGRRAVLSPCGTKFPATDYTEAVSTLPSSPAGDPHPCKFVATKTDGDDVVSQDSYSVLASFGANIKARSPGESTGNAEIGVGLAQYFATGVAAQLLAANGGAAVVSVSAGATESAKSTSTGQATSAVTGNIARSIANQPALIGREKEVLLSKYEAFKANMLKAQQLSTTTNWPGHWQTFVNDTTSVAPNVCEDKPKCTVKSSASDAFSGSFAQTPDALLSAATKWCKAVSMNDDMDCPKPKGDE